MTLRSCLLLLAWTACAPSDPGPASLPDVAVGPPDSGDTGLVDADGDGSPAGTDCDDANPFVSPDNLGVFADRCNGFDEDCDGVVDEDCPAEYVRLGDDGSYAYFYAPSITTSAYDHCDGLDARSPDPASLQDETIEAFVLSGVAAHHAADTAGAPATLMTGLYHLTFFGNDANGDPEFLYLRGLDPIDPAVSPWAPGQPTLLGVGTAEFTAIDLATGEYSVIDHTQTQAVACETTCVTRYLDADGDGDGDPAVSFTVCGENPDNAVSNSVDCDDADPDIGEICDPTADEDGDGSLAIDDCDDSDPWTFPGAYDRCDYYDEDCNVTGDEACALNSTYLLMTFDEDGGFEVVTYEGSGYYLNNDNQSWTAARAECQTLGGDLWVIDSETERTLVQAVTDDLAYNDDYWFGAWDENGDDDWRWVDGTDLSETDDRWFGNDPITDADCGRFFASYVDAPFLSEVCGGNRDSLCEVPCDTYYLDLDGDGIGRDGDTRIFCGNDVPSYVASVGGDCDDLDDTVGDSVWYVDEDGDGFHGTAWDQCDAPEGDAVIQTASEDCDEADVTINVANAVDTCNGLDDDCDGEVDENCACTWVEGDGTGYLFCTVALWAEDAEEYCNDQGGTLVIVDDATENATVLSVAVGLSNERWFIGGTDAAEEGTWLGGDGNPLPWDNWNGNEPNDGGSGEDCIELRTDGYWNDVNCDDRVNPFVCELPCADWYADEDGDGYSGSTFVRTHCGATNEQASTTPDEDCDDSDAAISPAAVEVCDPLDVDEDCDGDADDADDGVTGTFTWFVDSDGDGFGGEDVVDACEEPADATIDSSDCDDGDPDVRPDAVETCNGVDDDCDDSTDEDQVDGDGDGVCDDVDPCPLDAPDDRNRDGICDSAFAVQPAGFWPGQTTTLVVVNAPPSTRVYFGASRVGEGSGPCLTADDGSSVCVGLTSIVGLGTAMSDAAGNAFLQVTTPASFSTGDPVWIQALHLDGSGAATPVMSQTVQ